MKLKKIKYTSNRIKVKKTNLSAGSGVFYDSEYVHDFPAGNYYLHVHNSLPFYVDFKAKYSLKAVDYFLSNDYELVWSFEKVSTKCFIDPHSLVFEKNKTLVILKYKSESRGEITRFSDYLSDTDKESPSDYILITCLHSGEEGINALAEGLSEYIRTDKSKSKISLLMSTRGGMETIEQDIKHVDIDIASHYGEGFVPVHLKIIEKLNEEKGKGLVLLHGLPGTGKTNYIRYLCGKLNKEVIFLPPFMAESIAGPDFITFLIEHTNSILVIEDAEKVVLDREGDGSSRQSVANLLNLTDGILSDCLSIQIIATFNTSRDRIDKALLRKGRLIAEWKFDALSVEDSNNLFKSMGKEAIATKPMTLSEIYNSDDQEFVVQQERNQIGFGR